MVPQGFSYTPRIHPNMDWMTSNAPTIAVVTGKDIKCVNTAGLKDVLTIKLHK